MSLPKLTVPTFELTLPSTGKKIKYRPFLVKEHKILLTMVEADASEIARIITELVDICTFQKLDINTLPYFDIEYIFLQLRAKSISEAVDITVTCDQCGTKTETVFSIDNIQVQKVQGHSNKINLTDEYGIELQYPFINDVLEIYASKDTSKIVDLIIRCIKGVYDNDNYWEAKDQTREEIEEFVYSLTKQQFDKIEQFFVTAPKVVQPIEVKCSGCGAEIKTRLEGLKNFFV